MAAPLSDVVSLTITADSVGVARASFGIPMILSHTASWAERTRTYTSLAEVADDFDADEPEYLAANAMFAQNPHPTSIKIGRAALKPTMAYSILATAVNSTAYTIEVAGPGITTTTVTYTSDTNATLTEIHTGLVTALNNVAGNNYVAALNANPELAFTVTGDAAGDWFSLGAGSISLLAVTQTTADPGLATDLTAISVEDDDWYALYTLTNSKATVAAVAGHIEAVRKIYITDVCDTACATVAYTSELEDDVGAQQHTLARTRTALMFHPNPADMAGAAWIGAVLPFDPGSATWKFKTLSGVSPVTLTSTHRTNLRARKMNSYETIAGLNKTWEGMVASGEFIDVTQGVDWIYDDMTKSIYESLAAMPKVPFTDGGAALIEAEIRGTLSRAVDRDILAADPAPVVTVPRVSGVSSANKSIRNLPDVKWSATLSGAIHKVTINGVVSV